MASIFHLVLELEAPCFKALRIEKIKLDEMSRVHWIDRSGRLFYLLEMKELVVSTSCPVVLTVRFVVKIAHSPVFEAMLRQIELPLALDSLQTCSPLDELVSHQLPLQHGRLLELQVI